MTARGKKLLCYKELFISIKDKPRTEEKKKKAIHQDRTTNDRSTGKNRDMQVKR